MLFAVFDARGNIVSIKVPFGTTTRQDDTDIYHGHLSRRRNKKDPVRMLHPVRSPSASLQIGEFAGIITGIRSYFEGVISMLKTIIVPTDGSHTADSAVSLAADLASKYNAKIVLLHVLLRGHMPEGLLRAAHVEHIEKRAGDPEHLVNMPQEIMARVEGKKGTQMPLEVLEFIGKRILASAKHVCQDKGVENIEIAVEEGNPTQIILDYAKRHKADMIVMGSRGLTSLKGVLVGSVSTQVSHLATCTCVTVK